MRVVAAQDLPGDPLDASAAFHARVVPEVRAAIRGGELPVTVAFSPADHTHRGWRLAAVQALAREAAPGRVNGVVGSNRQAIAEALAYLGRAEGVTGQLLAVDGKTGETG